jgi:hypothetical protein
MPAQTEGMEIMLIIGVDACNLEFSNLNSSTNYISLCITISSVMHISLFMASVKS